MDKTKHSSAQFLPSTTSWRESALSCVSTLAAFTTSSTKCNWSKLIESLNCRLNTETLGDQAWFLMGLEMAVRSVLSSMLVLTVSMWHLILHRLPSAFKERVHAAFTIHLQQNEYEEEGVCSLHEGEKIIRLWQPK